jgi:deoxycytidine triphosphate deaminase
LLAAGLGAFLKTSVDAEHEGSIELEMANFDPYDGPLVDDD